MQGNSRNQKPFKKIILLAVFISFFSISSSAQDSTNKEFHPSGKIWGYAFGDYAYKIHADGTERGTVQYSKLPKNYNSFNFRRVYLGYDYHLSPNVSTQLILAHESSAEGNPSNPDVLTNGNRGIYIKAINIRFKKIIPRATIVAGQQSTPTFSTLSESVWGYRSIEKTLLDMRGISSSTDLGVGILGKIGKNENVGYNILVGNNNGAKPENNKSKKLYTSLYTYFFNKKLVVQGNFEMGTIATSPIDKRMSIFKLFSGYQTDLTSVGVEAFRQIKTNSSNYIKNGTDTAFADVHRTGISFFITHQLKKDKLSLFARYDIYNPDTKFIKDNGYFGNYSTYNETFATLGIDYVPYENVHIMPNLWYNRYQSKTTGIKSDYDLVGRVTLYFLFNK